MLQFRATFDLQRDVVSSIHRKEATVGAVKENSGALDTRILNVERDGGVLYSWKGTTGTTKIGKYDPNTKLNKLLYTFDKQVCVSSCSLNQEETLLAVSLTQRTRAEELLKPVSKCLTLLIEIQPVNNTKVLKAVDCRVKVQFVHPGTEKPSVLESHLLLLAEDGYVELYHVLLGRQEGYRVVILNPERLPKDRVAEEFSWVQWDSQTQRLFYLSSRDKLVLRCVQFYPQYHYETLFELPLELPSTPFTSMRFVNLGYDHFLEEEPQQEDVRMVVFTNRIGSMCVCYSQPVGANQEITYTIVLVHRGCSKTFTVELDGASSQHTTDLHPLFIPLGYYIVVFLSGHFLHCINTRQQELLCHSLFLSGADAELGLLGGGCVYVSLPQTTLLDLGSGRLYDVYLSSSFLLDLLHSSAGPPGPPGPPDTQDPPACSHITPNAQGLTPNAQGLTPNAQGLTPNTQGLKSNAQGLTPNTQGLTPNTQGLTPNAQGLTPNTQGLTPNTQGLTPNAQPLVLQPCSRISSSRPDNQRLAALHCLLVYMGPDPELELKIIDWMCVNVMAFDTFDQIQEFILASLYRIIYQKSLSLDKVLPYSSVFEKKEVPAGLDEVPGVTCTTEMHAEPVFRGKARSLKGYWEELRWHTDKIKYFEAVPRPRYQTSLLQEEWSALLLALKSEKKKSSNYLRHIDDNTKKVLSMVDTWCLDKKVVPLFQEEDPQQRALIGLMVEKLREHLSRHLPGLGKKKAESLVVSYVAKLLELIRHMLESVWLKYKLGPRVLCFKQQGSPAEWAVFHVMCRILEATRSLCLPLPPGYHTLLAVLGVRCLPRHTFLQYVDHGLLQLTETFVSRLMIDLDNSDANEELKFSILKRLPEPMEQRIYHQWDHPISSACISRGYVRGLLEKHATNKTPTFIERDKAGFGPGFLPLTYLAKILSDVEDQALNPFEEQENVDSRFVEETALKQTLILLGLEEK